MRIVYVTHSLKSCWNHGNAHFLRGVLRELKTLGHQVGIYEPEDSWSLSNLLRDHGAAGLASFNAAYPDLASTSFARDVEASALMDGADLVIVHEWTDPALVQRLGTERKGRSDVRLLFHDTHHRAVSDPGAIKAFDLSGYDGVLAFGASLAAVYRDWGWGDRAYVWHEAADTRLFKPPAEPAPRAGLVWIGNWGDGERTAEIEQFLLRPAAATALTLDVYGVRYPREALALLQAHGANYRGWAPNASVPGVFAKHLATVHVPRRYYASILPGIPTIRVFEALACGVPLVSAPWDDCERLFTPGEDFLTARDEAEMTRHLRRLAHEPDLRGALARAGRAVIEARHSCAHRARELISIAEGIQTPQAEGVA